jgi:hypothetical protein
LAVVISKGRRPGRCGGGKRSRICVLVLGISPAEAFGCLCPERIAARRGVAVQC